ncbi:MAG: sulfite exporter TauE/SafE family protein, partial [Gammaproteobacteria bacterium]
ASGPPDPARAEWKIVIDGLLVGGLTGFVGVGGGFLIVPALVLLGGLSMHRAIGTSLAIIALKSFAGFWKYLDVLQQSHLSLDWPVLAKFTVIGIAGSLLGNRLGRSIDQRRLKQGFGVFLILMAGFILWHHLPPSAS